MTEFLGPHAIFIISAYAGVALVISAIITVIASDAHRQKTRLAALETMGIRRRSSANRDKSA